MFHCVIFYSRFSSLKFAFECFWCKLTSHLTFWPLIIFNISSFLQDKGLVSINFFRLHIDGIWLELIHEIKTKSIFHKILIKILCLENILNHEWFHTKTRWFQSCCKLTILPKSLFILFLVFFVLVVSEAILSFY